jgi:hypothetical protein
MFRGLSSDVLEAQFGPTELEILQQDAETRIICTKVRQTGQILELSHVTFSDEGRVAFPEIHQAVLAGESMGKAFRRADIKFRRVVHSAYTYDIPASLAGQFGSRGQATIVNVSILIDTQTLYAKILEIYSPQVHWPQLVGKPTASQMEEARLLDNFLVARASQT